MFQEEPRPVPAAVWVLLGKLAVACKLGTPPRPNLLSSAHSPSPAQSPEIDRTWHAGWPLPPCPLHASTLWGLSQGHVFCSSGWGEALRPLPAWSGVPGFLDPLSSSPHTLCPPPGTLGLWVGLDQSRE